MREDLIERLRKLVSDAREMGDMYDVSEDLDTLLEAAAALEAAREDAERLEALVALVESADDRALLIHHGRLPNDRFLYCGLGLSNTGRTLRQAIDQARGKGVQS